VRLGLCARKPRQTIVWDGDSLTARPPAGGGTVSYPEFASERIIGQPLIVNIAVSGADSAHAGYDLTPEALAYVIMLGHNILNAGGTGASVLSALSAQIALVRSAGVQLVFVTKVFASALLVGTKETQRGIANAGMADLDADAVIDFEAADARFSNPNLFTDGTHDGEPLRRRRGEIAAAVINSVLTST